MRTLYLDKMPHDLDLMSLEENIGREVAEVLCDSPAINIYTDDEKKVKDAIYFLNMMDVKVLEVA